MIEEIFKLLFFLAISIFYFYSVSGFGKTLKVKYSNFFDLQFEGTIILLILSYFIYLTIGINIYLNILILLLGIIFYYYIDKSFIGIKFKYILSLFILIFSVLVISKTHEDFNGYHYFSIYEVFNNRLRIGVSNLNERFFHSSHLVLNQALIVLPYFNLKFIHLPVFIIYLSSIGYFSFLVFLKNLKKNELFFSIFCLLVLLVKFNRLSEFGYDYIAQFILLIVFHKIYFLNSYNEELVRAILYFTLCVLIKPISLFFLPIMIYIFFKRGIFFYKNFSLLRYFLFFLLVSTFVSSSFFKTGCLFYPLNSTCFTKDKIFWSEKQRVGEYSKMAQLWAKSYYNQNNYEQGSKYEKIEDKEIYLKKFNWLKFWIETHFFYKVSEFLLILLFSFILIYFYFVKLKQEAPSQNKDQYIILILSFISTVFWLNTAPQFRFGFSSIIILFFFIFNSALNLNIEFNKKKIVNLFILSLLILNIKNFNRIKNEFSREDFYKFKNFPFYNEIKIINDYSGYERDNFFHIEIIK